jgi:hypothetical protein
MERVMGNKIQLLIADDDPATWEMMGAFSGRRNACLR